jgi:nucleoid DNA-binding protein
MNKGELIDAIAEKSGVTKKEADTVLTAAIDTIIETVTKGDKVTLVGFGSFEKRDRKEKAVIRRQARPGPLRPRLFQHLALAKRSKRPLQEPKPN